MRWNNVSIQGHSDWICKQDSQKGCGLACAAMMFHRMGAQGSQMPYVTAAGTQVSGGEDLPRALRLNYTQTGGVPHADLFNWVRETIYAGVGVRDRLKHTPDELIAVLGAASLTKPAIVVLNGHYVLCVGAELGQTGKFAILDPGGGRYYPATVSKVDEVTVDGEKYTTMFDPHTTSGKKFYVQGVLYTSQPRP